MAQLDFQRLDDLLNYMIIQTSPVTLESLSQSFKVSGRTLRTDIKAINSSIVPNGAEIILIRKKGYILTYSNKEKFNDFWENAHSGTFLFTSAKSRIQYLLRLFLTTNRFISQKYLLTVLFVSQNTLYNDFRTLKTILGAYHLKIVNKSNLGYILSGDEQSIRLAINNLIFQEPLTDFITAANMVEKDICLNINYKQFSELFHSSFTKLVQLDSDYFHRNAFVSILLALSRIKDGHLISDFQQTVSLIPQAQKEIQNFIKSAEQTFHIKVPKDERQYLIYILSENFPHIIDSAITLSDASLVNSIVQALLSDLYTTTGASWVLDENLKRNLKDHIKRLLSIHTINSSRTNPILEAIKNNFPYPFELAVSAMQKIEKKFQISFTEDEISYIALYLASAIENSCNSYSISLAIICGTGKILSSIIESKIKKRFPNTFSEIKKLSYREFEHLSNKKAFHVIVSTVPIKNQLQKPIIFIDMNHLDDALLQIENKLSTVKRDNSTMNLFRPSHFMLVKEKISRETLLKRIAKILQSQGFVTENFLADVLARENISSTVINEIIALPHPIGDSVNQSAIFSIIAPKGIKWNHSAKVKFIFLLAIKAKDLENIQHIYDSLLDFVSSEKKQDSLLKNPSYKTLIEIISGQQTDPKNEY